MKYWLLALGLTFGLALTFSPAPVLAGSDSDSGSSGGSGRSVPELDPTAAGAAIVLMLGGVAYIASRRRKNDAG
jgi:hypothetical protein